MNPTMITGIIILAAGVLLLAVSQLLLRRWIKRYNKEWLGGVEQNDVS